MFLNPEDHLNDTFHLNVPPISQSTPALAPVMNQQQTVPNMILEQPPIVSDKTIKHFGGFMHEDATQFLAEFESYLSLEDLLSFGSITYQSKTPGVQLERVFIRNMQIF